MSGPPQKVGNDGVIHQAVGHLVQAVVGPALSALETAGSQYDNTSISLDKDGSTRTGVSAQARAAEIAVKRRTITEYALYILASRLRSPVPSDPSEALLWAQQRAKLKRTLRAVRK